MRDEHRIVHVDRLDCRIEPFDWIFARKEAARLDAHWAALRRTKPGLYDGRVLLAHRIEVAGDTLHAAYFETGYRSFLGWRDFGWPGPPIANCFAMAALRAADGAYMLGEMSAGTANAGKLYFPSGTPERADLRDGGRVDLEDSVTRELLEETGLGPDDITLEPGWTIVFHGPAVACMKPARARANGAELQARLAAHNATAQDPELSRLVPVTSPADYDPAHMPPFMLRYLDDALARGSARTR